MAQQKSNEGPSGSIEQQYIKEKKKSQILIATNIVTLVLLIGGGVWATQLKNNQPDPSNMPFGQQGGQRPGFVGGTPPGGGFMGMDIESYFKDDGSVDTDKVDEATENLPDEFKDRFLERMSEQIDQAVEDEDITSAQATELKQAFGISE